MSANTVNLDFLKRLTTRFEANKKFLKNKRIYYYFRARLNDDNTYTYYCFNPMFTFNKNFSLLEQKFKGIQGIWSLYTDNIDYELIEEKDKFTQLEMF